MPSPPHPYPFPDYALPGYILSHLCTHYMCSVYQCICNMNAHPAYAYVDYVSSLWWLVIVRMHIRECNRRYPFAYYLYVRMVVVTSERGGDRKKGSIPPEITPLQNLNRKIFGGLREGWGRLSMGLSMSEIYGVKIIRRAKSLGRVEGFLGWPYGNLSRDCSRARAPVPLHM